MRSPAMWAWDSDWALIGWGWTNGLTVSQWKHTSHDAHTDLSGVLNLQKNLLHGSLCCKSNWLFQFKKKKRLYKASEQKKVFPLQRFLTGGGADVRRDFVLGFVFACGEPCLASIQQTCSEWVTDSSSKRAAKKNKKLKSNVENTFYLLVKYFKTTVQPEDTARTGIWDASARGKL